MDTTAQLDPKQTQLWLRNSFTINISDLEGLKNDPIYRAFNGRSVTHKAYFAGRGDSSLMISVVGDPNLGKINWMRLVIYVDSSAGQKQQGDIWVNDLDLEGVNTA
jgi:cell surface protein SprA